MSKQHDLVLLFDCDNTLLDNDRFQADLTRHLEDECGIEVKNRYWQAFEDLRTQLGYADYLGALQRCRSLDDNSHILEVSSYLLDYPFDSRLYADALQTVAHCAAFGHTAILSDGDVVFQPHKIRRAGIWDAVQGRVSIYIHKEQMLKEMQLAYPARRYVMIDDKLRVLTAMKQILKERLVTVFPRQGRYALDPQEIAAYPPADLTLDRIGDLRHHNLHTLLERTVGLTTSESR